MALETIYQRAFFLTGTLVVAIGTSYLVATNWTIDTSVIDGGLLCDAGGIVDGAFTSSTISYADAMPPQTFVGSYDGGDGTTISAVSARTAIVAIPTTDAAPYPTVVLVHGGDWTQGPANVEYGQLLATYGYATVALNYRLVALPDGGNVPADGSDAGVALENQFPAAVSDVRCALRWVATNASTYGFDLARVALVGGSSGAQLATLAASVLTTQDSRWDDGTCPLSGAVPTVRLLIGFYGDYDYRVPSDGGDGAAPAQMLGAPVGTEPVSMNASPAAWVSVNLPSVLLLVSADDTVIPPTQSTDYLGDVLEAGASAGLVKLQSLGHAFQWFESDASGDQQTATCSALSALRGL